MNSENTSSLLITTEKHHNRSEVQNNLDCLPTLLAFLNASTKKAHQIETWLCDMLQLVVPSTRQFAILILYVYVGIMKEDLLSNDDRYYLILNVHSGPSLY